MQNIFDSHAHYDDERFAEDRDELLSSLPSKGVRYIMNAASSLGSAKEAIKLSQKYDFIYLAAGIHPHEVKSAPNNLQAELVRLSKNPKVMAIGEIGLDYHYDFSPRDLQKEIFEQQLATAKELGLPVIIHSREADADTMVLLKKYKPMGVVHCFSSSVEIASEVLKLGMYLGFTGVVTFKNAKRPLEVLKTVPLDRLLLETDCPYMAPEPYRGKRCDSSMIVEISKVVAQIKEISAQQCLDLTCQNACKLFNIPSQLKA